MKFAAVECKKCGTRVPVEYQRRSGLCRLCEASRYGQKS